MRLSILLSAYTVLWLLRVAFAAASAFVIMLALGVAHAYWSAAPALGFLAVWILVLGLEVAISLLKAQPQEISWEKKTKTKS